MTLMLRKNPDTFAGENYEGEKYFVSPGVTYCKVLVNNASNDSLNFPFGKSVFIEYDYTKLSEIGTLKELFFHFKIHNASTTETARFRNPYGLIDKIEIVNNHVDSTKTIVMERIEILQKYNEYLLNCKSRDELDFELYKNTNNFTESTSLTGILIPSNGTVDVKLDLLAIMPDLYRNHKFGGGVTQAFQSIQITIYFARDVANADEMTEYVQSNTTNNPIDNSKISFSNMKFVRNVRYTNDGNLLNFGRILTYYTYYKSYKTDIISWNVVGTDYYRFSPSHNKYSNFNKIIGFSAMIKKKPSGTAFNDADACKYYSGPKYIGYTIKKDDVEILNYKGSDKLQARKEYLLTYVRNRYDTTPPRELIDDSSDLDKYIFTGSTYIDTSNLKTESADAFAISTGVNNDTIDEIVFTCESPVSTSCELIICFHVYGPLPL
eukprot:PhM_4_TR2094/c4_g1_i1/m.20466